MQKDQKVAIIVGITVIVSTAIMLGVVSVLSKWNAAIDGFTVKVKYNFLNDVLPGAPVKLAGGIQVGYIKDIRQENVTTIVEVYLESSMKGKIPKSPRTQFAIFTTGMMGQKYINLTVQDENWDGPFLKEGDLVQGVDPPSIDQIMLSFTSWFDGKNGGQVLAEVVKETKAFISGLNNMLAENRQDVRDTVKLAKGSLGKLSEQMESLMNRLNSMSADFNEISKRNKEDIKLMLQNLSHISRDFNIITERIQSGRGSVGRFIYDDELYHNMNQAADYAKVFFKRLRDNPYLLLYKRK